jgi:hypothetical protein
MYWKHSIALAGSLPALFSAAAAYRRPSVLRGQRPQRQKQKYTDKTEISPHTPSLAIIAGLCQTGAGLTRGLSVPGTRLPQNPVFHLSKRHIPSAYPRAGYMHLFPPASINALPKERPFPRLFHTIMLYRLSFENLQNSQAQAVITLPTIRGLI